MISHAPEQIGVQYVPMKSLVDGWAEPKKSDRK